MNNSTSFQRLQYDLETAILSVPIVYIQHYDYYLIESALKEACITLNFDYKHVCSLFLNGVGELKANGTGKSYRDSAQTHLDRYLAEICRQTEDRKDKRIFVIENFSFNHINEENEIIGWLQLFAKQHSAERKGTDLGESLSTIVLIDPEGGMLPSAIEKIVYVVSVYPPTLEEIKEFVDKKNRIADSTPGGNPLPHNSLYYKDCEELCRSLQGLHHFEIQQILKALSIDTVYGDFIPGFVNAAMKEKKKIVQKSGLLEVIETDVELDSIGGLSALREDIKKKSTIFKKIRIAADVFHVPIPKGVLILGMPGCGKSMMAKAIANEFEVSLLRLDMNKVLGQYVGQSEQNFRKVLDLAEAASPCVLWIDEIEKAFSGTSGSRGHEGNDVVMRMMGLFLTWMQEHTKPVYIVATANDVMRPEFMRKGRFDEVYYVGFPEVLQAIEIFKKKIESFNKKNKKKRLFFSENIKERLDELYDLFINNEDLRKKFYDELIKVTNEEEKNKISFKEYAVSDNIDAARLLYYSRHFTGAEIENVVNQAIEQEFLSIVKAEELETANREIKINRLINLAMSLRRQRISAQFDADKEKIDKALKGHDKNNLKDFEDPISRIYILQEENHFKNADFGGD